MTVGSFRSLEVAEQVLAEGKADFIGMSKFLNSKIVKKITL